MKSDRQVYDAYSDFLEPGDEDLVGVVRDLDTFYTAAIPPRRAAAFRAVPAGGITREAGARTSNRWDLRPYIRLPRRPFAALGTLILAVALAGAGYDALPTVERALQLNPGVDQIPARDLGRRVAMSQSKGGFTITVGRVYADVNRIVVGYTMSGPPGRTFDTMMAWGEDGEAHWPKLYDSAGREYRHLPLSNQPGMEGGVQTTALAFDAAGLEGASGDVRLSLRIGQIDADERLGDGVVRAVRVEEPFRFDFTVPVERGRTAKPHQVVESAGQTVTLERFATTPTGTRVWLRGVGQEASMELSVGGSTYELSAPSGVAVASTWTTDELYEYVSEVPLMDKRGEWILTVRPDGSAYSAKRLGDRSWVFRFTVP